ncbi:MAG: hypothetical protein M1830_005228 [Pleopsidium flavum]|nr:MAG: hypothetical protein M1830_005228 [Pleopsidium flavum]
MRFSMIPIFSAALVGLASAYTQPVGDTPSGNSIVRPGLGEIVSVGTPYTVSWNPTTQGTVTLVLLRGPSTNVIPLYPIAEKVANTGSYVWTPSTSLEADITHYGIQLIVDATGQYQYTTQFGISNPSSTGSSSSAPSSSAVAPSTTSMIAVSQIADGQIQAPASAVGVASAAYPINSANATSPISTTSPIVAISSTVATSSSIVAISSTVMTSSSIVTSVYVPVSSVNAPYVASTGLPVSNSSIVQPTGSMSVPATLQTMTAIASATQATTPSSATTPARATGAAGRVAMSAGGLFAGAGAVLALLM